MLRIGSMNMLLHGVEKPDEQILGPHGGYRNLKSFQVAQLVYDLTVRFCDRYINRRSRTHDQMVQAARSGVQSIPEGSEAAATSSKTELKLTQVAWASLEELKLDYEFLPGVFGQRHPDAGHGGGLSAGPSDGAAGETVRGRRRLQREVAGLPAETATDDIESRLFDLTALRMQLALAEADEGAYELSHSVVAEPAKAFGIAARPKLFGEFRYDSN